MGVNFMRILVVQDKFQPEGSAADFLRTQGHDVETVATANEALRLAPSFAPDLVMFDVRIADPARSNFAQKLRSMPGLDETMVVVGLSLPRASHAPA